MVSREVPEGQQKELWAWGRGGVVQVVGSLSSIPGGNGDGVGRGGAGQPPLPPTLRIPSYRALPSHPHSGAPTQGPAALVVSHLRARASPSLSGSGGQTAISQATPAALPPFPRFSAHGPLPTAGSRQCLLPFIGLRGGQAPRGLCPEAGLPGLEAAAFTPVNPGHWPGEARPCTT